MITALRLVYARWRRFPALILLRLTGILLAALLAATVPTFVSGSMERSLAPHLQQDADRTILVDWQAGVSQLTPDQLAAASRYLSQTLPGTAGISHVEAVQLPSTSPSLVQTIDAAGKIQAAKRYYSLGPAPSGLRLSQGRLPVSGQPEVLVSPAMVTAGYGVGTRLRVSLTPDGRGAATEVTVVGVVQPADSGVLQALSGAFDRTLLTSPDYWQSLNVTVQEQVWSMLLPADALHAAEVPLLAEALTRMPLYLAQAWPNTQVLITPQLWLSEFAAQMATTRRFLLTLLLPVFLLVLIFISATASAVVANRQTEIAVLRSRGMSAARVVVFYLPESVLLAVIATGAALSLTVPAVQLMGLATGFLQLVGRPPLMVGLGRDAVFYAAGASLAAEGVACVPLIQATRQTVATLRQEATAQSMVQGVLRIVAELVLMAVVLYGTWQLRGSGSGGNPSLWVLPPLMLAAAGILFLRLFEGIAALVERLFRRRLPAYLYLSLSSLRKPTARHRVLALMLVITIGMGIYGAAFAHTLDRDLSATIQYQLGADTVLTAYWEMEVLAVDSNGQPTKAIYHEPPYPAFQGLPGAAAETQVQRRPNVSLTAGTRSLGNTDLYGIEPQAFSRVARILPDLTPDPALYLNGLAQDEQGVILSRKLADRLHLKPGDQISANQQDLSAPLTIIGVVDYWPGVSPDEAEFAIANLPYLQRRLGLNPYDVWLRLQPGAPLQPLVDELVRRQVRVKDIAAAQMELAQGRRLPSRLGIYATLSAGFLVAMLAMILTYLLSVGLTLQSRARELGVVRAMGMTARQVAVAVYLEQLTVVATAAAAGLGAGQLAAALYVPAFRQQPGEVQLPLRVEALASDRLTTLLLLAGALSVGAAVVAAQLRRLNVTRTLRLGEDG